MDLELFDKLTNTIKENEEVKEFVKDLNNFLENDNSERNQISILEKMQNEANITVSCRDKMYTERERILQNYANKTIEKGTMYYIYDKNDNYIISICQEGKSHEIIEAKENELPIGAGVDSVLRIKNGKYILDREATNIIQKEMKEKYNELLEEQNKEMKARRIEGHLYEFVENSGDRVWLLDKDMPKDDAETAFEVFDEFEFPEELLNFAKEGDIFKYQNGRYHRI